MKRSFSMWIWFISIISYWYDSVFSKLCLTPEAFLGFQQYESVLDFFMDLNQMKIKTGIQNQNWCVSFFFPYKGNTTSCSSTELTLRVANILATSEERFPSFLLFSFLFSLLCGASMVPNYSLLFLIISFFHLLPRFSASWEYSLSLFYLFYRMSSSILCCPQNSA